MRALVLLAFVAVPAAGQSAPDKPADVARIDACLAGPGDAHACTGEIFLECVRESDAPQDTLMGWKDVDRACAARELSAWDGILNRDYRALREIVAAFDAGAPDALREAQRAWIAYRDAECAWPLSFLRGNDAHHAEVQCPLTATAERAIELHDWLEHLQ